MFMGILKEELMAMLKNKDEEIKTDFSFILEIMR